ncbi:MAG: PLD nuclease N-terminal domain-containing protein [Aliidiomarina sp.]|uniref:PLD nuclease N-terminal domain-containing protein n=1 Tax=Aliidiomarina sp. TaxID=1872439 RepID=UPI0025BE0881|nr:PLD nuclease N-terminal domain-containing protein [Aliidiomarina sp.]MCH8502168.1 PLD nuclease N-terminal domain-containing protein [Aliidiomarina sp.]MCL5254763.1 PLD nuclease N-terminal domain-containing protein [Gammaproteobacteria bacterium]
MGVEVSGLLGLIVLILNIYAIVKTVQSGAGTGSKVLWIVLIILLPVIGFILWFLLGPKG